MTLDRFGTVLFLASLMAVLAAFEVGLPFRACIDGHGRVPANLGLTVSTWLLNAILASAAALALPSGAGEGLWSFVPLWVQIGLSVVLLDLFGWVAHYTMHRVPILWKVHRVHHTDPFVDV